jgi:hypothetical protein
MQAAASIDASATGFGIGTMLPSGAPPVPALMYPPDSMIASNGLRSTIRSRTIGNAAARHGSMVM